jgi:hypothetical protein
MRRLHPTQYAKDEQDPENVYMRITSYNRGPDPATLHVIPQLWFKNTWSWPLPKPEKPSMTGTVRHDINCINVKHETLGKTHLYCLPSPPPVDASGEFQSEGTVDPELLFTENDTNFSRLYGGQNDSHYVKDAFHDHIIPSHRPLEPQEGEESFFTRHIRSRTASQWGGSQISQDDAVEEGPCTPFPANNTSFVNPNQTGTKAAAHYVFENVPGNGGCVVVRVKLTPLSLKKDPSLEDDGVFDDEVENRRQEADEFYSALVLGPMTDDLKQVMRQALGGMLWTKQFYQFIQKEWIEGDPAQPPPPPERKWVRNRVINLIYSSFCPLTELLL